MIRGYTQSLDTVALKEYEIFNRRDGPGGAYGQ